MNSYFPATQHLPKKLLIKLFADKHTVFLSDFYAENLRKEIASAYL